MNYSIGYFKTSNGIPVKPSWYGRATCILWGQHLCTRQQANILLAGIKIASWGRYLQKLSVEQTGPWSYRNCGRVCKRKYYAFSDKNIFTVNTFFCISCYMGKSVCQANSLIHHIQCWTYTQSHTKLTYHWKRTLSISWKESKIVILNLSLTEKNSLKLQ